MKFKSNSIFGSIIILILSAVFSFAHYCECWVTNGDSSHTIKVDFDGIKTEDCYNLEDDINGDWYTGSCTFVFEFAKPEVPGWELAILGSSGISQPNNGSFPLRAKNNPS